jgi:hypothetical protein
MAFSYTTATDFWHERDFGQKVTAIFEFIGAHWRPLGRVLLYLGVPAALLHGIVSALLQSQLMRFLHDDYTQPMEYGYLSSAFHSPLYYLNTMVTSIFQAVLILSVYGYLVECLHPTQPGAPITVATVWANVKKRFLGTFTFLFILALLWAAVFFLYSTGEPFAIFGFVVLSAAGAYLAVTLSLFFIVQAVEDRTFGAAFSRCRQLMRGNWWATFGLIFLILFLLGMLRVGAGMLTALLVASLTGAGLLGAAGNDKEGLSLIGLLLGSLSTIISLVLYPPILLTLAFQYFDLAERQEGVGLRYLIAQLGQAPPASPTHSTYSPDEEGEY